MGLTSREIVHMIAYDGLDAVLERVQTDNAFVRKHGLESLRETFSLDYPSYILCARHGRGQDHSDGLDRCDRIRHGA